MSLSRQLLGITCLLCLSPDNCKLNDTRGHVVHFTGQWHGTSLCNDIQNVQLPMETSGQSPETD
eukprot:350796-Chlamydomonas_euryale.AAC.8